ncbi:MAG: hypothetical protein NTX96_00115 [Candidatus Zambryskibacteria bacterium]|nr:hypothetical protein [Candidatus Zambryskibacteria bacterium]
MNTQFYELLQRIKNLKLKKKTYALFGSAPIVVRSIREFSNDIDVIVNEDIWNEYLDKNGWEYKKFQKNNSIIEAIVSGKIEFYKSWAPGDWDIQELIDKADDIDGIPYVNLKDVLEWKKLNRRPKDMKDIHLIEEYINNNL